MLINLFTDCHRIKILFTYFIIVFLDSEWGYECINFTMMFVLFFFCMRACRYLLESYKWLNFQLQYRFW